MKEACKFQKKLVRMPDMTFDAARQVGTGGGAEPEGVIHTLTPEVCLNAFSAWVSAAARRFVLFLA